jgi:hypothetical protein
MAKMTKTEAAESGMKAAQLVAIESLLYRRAEDVDAWLRERAVEDTQGWSYNERDWYTQAYLNAALKRVGAAILQQQAAREHYANATKWLSMEAAVAAMSARVADMHVPGLVERGSSGGYFSVYIETPGVFASEASVSVTLRRSSDERRVVDPDNSRRHVTPITAEVSINWSGSTRSLAAARVALRNYRAALAVADELSAWLEQTKIGWAYDGSQE